MIRITDFHSHILPGIDDGSHSVEQSLAMLTREAEQGIGCVVATPHFYPRRDDLAKFLDRRTDAMQRLQAAMEGRTDLPTVKLGAEVRFFSGMSDCEELSQLTIGEKRCILIEVPDALWTAKRYDELEQIWVKQGLTPVIAHIERYIHPLFYRRVMDELAQLPVLVQSNASFFLNKDTEKLAMRLLRQKRIHVLGSDCHDMDGRAPNLGPAMTTISEKLGADAQDWIRYWTEQVI